MSDKYSKIDNGICPECDRKMEWVELEGHQCNECGAKYRFNDDMGPGSYSAKYIEGGKFWKLELLNEIMQLVGELGGYYHEYDHRIELLSDNIVELVKELESKKEKDSV